MAVDRSDVVKQMTAAEEQARMPWGPSPLEKDFDNFCAQVAGLSAGERWIPRPWALGDQLVRDEERLEEMWTTPCGDEYACYIAMPGIGFKGVGATPSAAQYRAMAYRDEWEYSRRRLKKIVVDIDDAKVRDAARHMAETIRRGFVNKPPQRVVIPDETTKPQFVAPQIVTCRGCGHTGSALDEFVSPYTGLCVACTAASVEYAKAPPRRFREPMQLTNPGPYVPIQAIEAAQSKPPDPAPPAKKPSWEFLGPPL